MAATTTAFQQLQGFLKDMFQFGDTDLDFGIYRITRLKREFIEAFIDGDGDTSLRATVTQALGHVRNQRGEAAQNWLDAFAGTLGQKGKPCWNALADKPDDKQLRAQFEALFVVAEDADRALARFNLDVRQERRDPPPALAPFTEHVPFDFGVDEAAQRVAQVRVVARRDAQMGYQIREPDHVAVLRQELLEGVGQHHIPRPPLQKRHLVGDGDRRAVLEDLGMAKRGFHGRR